MSVTSNMSLQIPDNGDSDYPTKISNSFNLIDDHDHSSGNGIQIPRAGITDLAINAAKIDNLTITRGKLAAVGQQISSLSTISSTSAESASSISVSIITTGRPVILGLIASATAGDNSTVTINSSANQATGRVRFYRDSTLISESSINMDETATSASSQLNYGIAPCAFNHIDTPSSGTYAYSMRVYLDNGNSMTANNIKLFAYEL